MKQIIPFVKDISLGPKISEITSIALEHNLKMENNDSIVGTFTISGKYKMNEVSINEEEFEKDVDFDITLDDKYDALKATIDIDDFYYEIINEGLLRVHINVLIDNLVYFKEKVKEVDENQRQEVKIEEILEENEDLTDQRNVIIKKEDMQDNIINNEKNIDDVKDKDFDEKREDVSINVQDITKSINSSFLKEEEQYVTYKVHIIRENETIDTIIEKYGVCKEELEKYNNLDNIILGSKIIVPIDNE